MFVNRLQSHWAEGRATLNGWLALGNALGAEIVAAQGYDSLTLDMQHGAIDDAAMLAMLQAMRASGVTPLVRVPWLEPGAIMRALDAGAQGVICPMVNSAGEAARLVDCMRYPPLGGRSHGPLRARLVAGESYAEEANARVLAIAMIETRAAMDALEEIAAVPGLDAFYIGPSDLTLSLSEGRLPPRYDPGQEMVASAIRRIVAVARANGLRVGLHCGTVEQAAQAVGWGCDMVTVGDDAQFLARGAADTVARYRALKMGPSPG